MNSTATQNTLDLPVTLYLSLPFTITSCLMSCWTLGFLFRKGDISFRSNFLIYFVQIWNIGTQLMGILGAILSTNNLLTFLIGANMIDFNVNAGSILVLAINFVNLNTLAKFSVLDPQRLTSRLVKSLKITWVFIYLIFATPNIAGHVSWALYGYQSPTLKLFSYGGAIFYTFTGVLYDNLQFYYISRLILKWRSKQDKGRLEQSKTALAYRQVLYVSLAALVVDWSGVGLLIPIAMDLNQSIQDGFSLVGVALIGIHSTLAVYALELVIELALSKAKEGRKDGKRSTRATGGGFGGTGGVGSKGSRGSKGAANGGVNSNGGGGGLVVPGMGVRKLSEVGLRPIEVGLLPARNSFVASSVKRSSYVPGK